ncbi:WD40-repeat-containing domain protein, partial [Lentinula raphanica]
MSSFERLATLSGPQHPIHAIAFSADAKYLAAVGFFGIIVWDLPASEDLKTPIERFEARKEHKFTTTTWLRFKTDVEISRHVLVVGSLDGQITALDLHEEDGVLQYTRQPASHTPPEQTVLSLDHCMFGAGRKCRGQVVASFFDRSVRSWTLSLNGDFNFVFSMQLNQSFLPKTVRIQHETRHIYVFSSKGGKRAILHPQSGTIMRSIENGCEDMSYVAMDQSKDRFVTCTGDGYQLFRTSNLCHLRTFEDSATPPVHHPCQVAFVEDGRKIVAGTDQGKVLIFDSEAGYLEQTLMYPGSKMVQTVATCTVSNDHYVAIAGSAAKKTSDVIVWQKKVQVPPSNSTRSVRLQNGDPIVFLLHRSTAKLFGYASICIILAVSALMILTKREFEITVPVIRFFELNVQKWLEQVIRATSTSQILPALARIFETNVLNRLGLQFVNGGT